MTLLILALTLIILLASAATVAAATPKLPGQIARTVVATWTCSDQLGQPRTRAYSPWKPHTRSFRIAQLNLWTNRLHACQAALAERKRQWDWQAWLPDKWQRIGACETGYGQRPGDWTHSNSGYVSAFGIQRGAHNGAYDSDARKVGMPPWSDDPRSRPTPWQQYQTALSHYNQFGGFSGWGCRGA